MIPDCVGGLELFLSILLLALETTSLPISWHAIALFSVHIAATLPQSLSASAAN